MVTLNHNKNPLQFLGLQRLQRVTLPILRTSAAAMLSEQSAAAFESFAVQQLYVHNCGIRLLPEISVLCSRLAGCVLPFADRQRVQLICCWDYY